MRLLRRKGKPYTGMWPYFPRCDLDSSSEPIEPWGILQQINQEITSVFGRPICNPLQTQIQSTLNGKRVSGWRKLWLQYWSLLNWQNLRLHCACVAVPANWFFDIISSFFAKCKNVVHSLEPGETPSNTLRCGCGAVAFIFSIYLKPWQYFKNHKRT